MMFTTEVSVPPQASFTSLVQSFVEDASWRAGLNGTQRRALARSTGLAFESIVRDAMAGATEPIRIVATCTPHQLRVALFERGMPLDETIARRNAEWGIVTADVDESHWQLHGKHGTELELAMTRPAMDREMPDIPLASHTEAVAAPPQNYTIRRFEPADSAGVARLFYGVYAYAYTFPAVYVPDRLIALNGANDYISMVAVAEDGEIAGHYALHRDPGTPIAEGCGAVVSPAHRGRDLLKRLRQAAETEAQRLDLAAYYSEPVTSHGRTQHESEEFGATASAIWLGMSPPAMLARDMHVSSAGQRQSFMLYFKALKPRETRTIYAPARHRAMIEKIYARLGLPVEILNGERAADGRGDVQTSIAHSDGCGTIVVRSVGSETDAVAMQAMSDLRNLTHLGALYALLPLEQSGTPELCEALEQCGFFFCGAGPWMIDGSDALILQMPLTPIDMSRLTIEGAFGRELGDYIKTFVA